MSDTDLQLLARYTRDHAEDAFAEIVHRHLDLVHSAALRQVRLPQLAEEVAQSVFTDLSRNARKLQPDTILTAWLYQVTRRTAIDVVRREARRQLREQIATEMNTINATDSSRRNPMEADWTHIEPLLDEAMHALDDTDRAAVLLHRYELLQSGKPDNSADLVKLAVYADEDYDSNHGISINGAWGDRFNRVSGAVEIAAEAFAKANKGRMPSEPSQIMPYLKKPIDADTVQKYLNQIAANVNANRAP